MAEQREQVAESVEHPAGCVTTIDFDGASFSDVLIYPVGILKSRTVRSCLLILGIAAVTANVIDLSGFPFITQVVVMLVACIGIVLALLDLILRERRAARNYEALAETLEAASTLLAVRAQIGWGFTSKMPLLAKAVWKSGLRGQTIRVVSRRTFPILSPLSVTFEPCDLKELNEQFQLLASSLPGTEIADSNIASASTGHKVKTAKFKRKNLRSAILWHWPTTILLSASFMLSIINGRPNWLMGLAVIISLLGILLNSSTTPPLASSNWKLLPGALLYQRPMGFLFGRRQHLFRRTDSLLFLWYFGFGVWAFWVGDDRYKRQMMIQPVEAQMLLRAWLSPVPPPTDEQLAQLLPS